MGLSSAYFLKRLGLKVTLIDKGHAIRSSWGGGFINLVSSILLSQTENGKERKKEKKGRGRRKDMRKNEERRD